MDFRDISKFKPSLDLKRAADDDDDDDDVAAGTGAKRARTADGGSSGAAAAAAAAATTDHRAAEAAAAEAGIDLSLLSAEERARVLEMLEADDEDEVSDFDRPAFRRLVLALERAVTENSEQRAKHSDDPTKYINSELKLHEQILEFAAAATAPQYYEELRKLNNITTLVGLLGHENTDIAVATISLLQEMTDPDALEGHDEQAHNFVLALLEEEFLAMLVGALERLDESNTEDAKGVHQALGIIENMVDLAPEVSEKIGQDNKMLSWLMGRLTVKQFDANRLYCSEILAILLQTSEANRRKLGESSGIDVLLHVLAAYRHEDPSSNEEMENMENVFDTLCSALQDNEENRKRFVASEGTELMILLLRKKRLSRAGALKVLNHAMSDKYGAPVCSRFVEQLGLKSLFPCFMKTPSKIHKKGYIEGEFEEHVVSVIAALLRNLEDAELRNRVLGKFAESGLAKVDRLVELHLLFHGKVSDAEEQLDADIPEDEAYLQRMDAGLFPLQLVDYIMGEVWFNCGDEVRDRIERLMHMKNASVGDVRKILTEYAENVGDPDDPELTELEQEHIRMLANQLSSKKK